MNGFHDVSRAYLVHAQPPPDRPPFLDASIGIRRVGMFTVMPPSAGDGSRPKDPRREGRRGVEEAVCVTHDATDVVPAGCYIRSWTSGANFTIFQRYIGKR